VEPKFCCLHALADGNQCIWIRQKMLEFLVVLPALSLYHGHVYLLHSYILVMLAGWQEGHPACKNMGDGGGGHWLARMEWHPARQLVCLPLLIFPCTIKVQKFSSGTGSRGWSRKKGHKTVVVWWWYNMIRLL